MTHWTPPNRGKSDVTSSVNVGMGGGTTLFSGALSRPADGGTSRPRGGGKGEDPTIKDKSHRSQRTTSSSETYGPAGVVMVCRSYHGEGCPDCGNGKPMRTMASAMGPQDQFRSGSQTGYQGG